jgi:hypothetical protein
MQTSTSSAPSTPLPSPRRLPTKAGGAFGARSAGLLMLLAIAAPAALAAGTPVRMANDAFTVSYKMTDAQNASARQIYLDTDQSARTGFTIGGVGADYLLINSNLYVYTGKGGYDWSWKWVSQVSYEIVGGAASWVVPRRALGAPKAINLVGKLEYASSVALSTMQTQLFSTSLVQPGRDALKWPFSQASIWNMPIGSLARYVPANLPAVPGNDPWAPMPAIDPEPIVLRPNASATPVYYNNAGWTLGANRCEPTGPLLMTVPMPSDFVVPNSRLNNSATFLMADQRTLQQLQPLARCVAGGGATSIVSFPPVDLYGNGEGGAHGGSGLSAIGGTLRLGELRPGKAAPRHALKLDVDSREVLFRCVKADRSDCLRWPATKADSDAVGSYGTLKNVQNFAMRMGALLAIPTAVNIGALKLETEAARQLAWTMQNYGMYIVDSTGGPSYFIAAEDGADGAFRTQFKADWGFEFGQRVRDNTPWTRDMQKLMTALSVVDNNGPGSIGGGGKPLQALAPPLPAL